MSIPEENTCADCGQSLSPDEAWCCSDCCAFYEMTEPHTEMTGDDDG